MAILTSAFLLLKFADMTTSQKIHLYRQCLEQVNTAEQIIAIDEREIIWLHEKPQGTWIETTEACILVRQTTGQIFAMLKK